jgi:hypothetical protein
VVRDNFGFDEPSDLIPEHLVIFAEDFAHGVS